MPTRNLTRFTAAATVLSAALAAQSSLIIPTVAQAADGNTSTSWPFDVANIDLQYIYDSTHFTGNGITFPILITGIKLRANGTTTSWVGGTSTLQVDLSTSPIDFLAITNTFASNHGADQTTVFNGSLIVAPGSATTGSPGPFHADIPFTTSFLYDPTSGDDLTIEYISQGIVTANYPTLDAVSTAGVALARRIQTTTIGNPTGTIWSGESAHAMEITYTPASGLYAGFTADVVAGPSPLTVNFTDTSFSSTPGGVTGWEWDFDNDGTVDSTLQNPQHVFTTCGDFDVRLRVTDGAFPASVLVKPDYIVTDEIVASFSYSLLVPPNIFQFTDTSSPAATSWEWDFDSDGTIDDTTQNPVLVLPPCQSMNVTLTAHRNCQSDSASQVLFIAPNEQTTLFAANNGLSAAVVMSDLEVTNPSGISICAFAHNCGTTAIGTAFTYDVYLTDGGYTGKDNDITQWRLVGSGSGVAAGNDVPAASPLNEPIYLPPGVYGIGLWLNGSGVRYTGTGTHSQLVVSNADLTIRTGAARSTLFNGGSFFEYRNWNGSIYYDTPGTSGLNGFGFLGTGCPGALPVATQTATSPPQLGGTLTVEVDNLPVGIALMAAGFSSTLTSSGVPLPLDLTLLGMPGCILRVSPDVLVTMVGLGNTATFSLPIPMSPALSGGPLFLQPLVLDNPPVNPFGWVIGDASGSILGL